MVTGHDIKLNSSTTSVALTLTIVLQNLPTSIVIAKSGLSNMTANYLTTRTRCRDQANPVPCKRGPIAIGYCVHIISSA